MKNSLFQDTLEPASANWADSEIPHFLRRVTWCMCCTVQCQEKKVSPAWICHTYCLLPFSIPDLWWIGGFLKRGVARNHPFLRKNFPHPATDSYRKASFGKRKIIDANPEVSPSVTGHIGTWDSGSSCSS